MNISQDKRILETITKTYPNCKNISIQHEKVSLPMILIKSSIFGNKIISLPFMDVGYFSGKLDKKDIKNLSKTSAKLIKIKLNSFDNEYNKKINSLKKNGFLSIASKQQYIIPLEDPNKIWKNFHKHTRNDIRKSEKSNLILKNVLKRDELKIFYKLYFKEMKRFGTPPHSFRFFENLLKIFKNDFFGMNCYKNNKIVASSLILIYQDYAYLWFNVSNPKFRKFRPNDLLYWSSINECFKRNIKLLDVGQIDIASKDKREQGLSKFKQKWPGKVYDKIELFYYFDKKDKKNENTTNKENLKKLRKIWALLPGFIIKFIGPKINSELGI